MPPQKKPLADRFWPKVDRSEGPNSCWPWTRAFFKQGYGAIGDETRKPQKAHRVAWQLTNGPIPSGFCVLHRCDNRACCNPAHLFLGTIGENNTDMWSKGRGVHPDHAPRGIESGKAKLTEAQVLEIRARYAQGGIFHWQLALEYGVTRSNIGAIITRKSWRHI